MHIIAKQKAPSQQQTPSKGCTLHHLNNLIMKKHLLLFPILLFLIAAAPALLTGTIVGISDGDTVTLLTAGNVQYKIRLAGIDCPEKSQAFAQQAKQFTSDMVFQKYVSVQVHATDRYGRNVGEVFLAGGTSVNKEIVKAGYAWHYKQYSNDPELDRLEAEAREAKRGLWADPSPTPPWEYRRGKRSDSNKSESMSSDDTRDAADHLSILPIENTSADNSTVVFNVNTFKVHCPHCSAAIRCTRSCIQTSAADARSRGGIPCKLCGGCF